VAARTGDTRILHEIVSTVASTLELDEVLRAVVRLLLEGSGVHACFVYLLDADGDRLVMRAASPPYARHVGSITLARGEGLSWWAAEHREPAFIRDDALADPRVKYVPELEEERFQSLLALPIVSRGGEVIGVVTAHTEAPREFTDDNVDFLVSSASLVAGAIENARLYEEARERVAELELLAELAEAVATAEGLDELVTVAAVRAQQLLAARACHLYLLDPASEALQRRASHPEVGAAAESIGLAELGPELLRSSRALRLAIPLVASDELLGLLEAEGTARVELGRAIASQVAVGVKKVQLIERLTEKNLIKDFFEELAAGRGAGALEGRAARLGCDLSQPHVVLIAEPADDALERALAGLGEDCLFDRRDASLRALVRVRAGGGAAALQERLVHLHQELARPIAIGVSSVCIGEESFATGFEEAREALVGTAVIAREPAVVSYEDLGAYKYLLKVALDGGVRDRTVDAVGKLLEYDRQRGASLLATLEEFLARRGSIAATSEALFVHPNTLRQRLRRIAELSGLDLRRDDWLAVEIAVKMVKLQDALGTAKSDT
jgi:GAF domain-containing protein